MEREREYLQGLIHKGVIDRLQASTVWKEFRARREAGEAIELGALLVARGLVVPVVPRPRPAAGPGAIQVPAPRVRAVPEPEPADSISPTVRIPEALAPDDLPDLPDLPELPALDGELGGALPAVFGGAERYEILETLGQGGMGKVVLARDRELDRDVAIKTLLSGDRSDILARFVQEAKVTGQLEHPNIVPIHEMGMDRNGDVFIVMKRVKGENLRDRIEARGPATPESLAEILPSFLKVCDAVAYAHSRGVIHRDLKPENVMIGEFGEVLVMDWGLAKVLGNESAESTAAPAATSTAMLRRGSQTANLTVDGQVQGTPAYMPPEQARGEPLDERADVYSLGAVLYAILTGVAPYSGSTVLEILTLVSEGNLEPPSALASVPRELEAVVLKAMAPVRARRYRDVLSLQADLRAFLAGRTLGAARYSPGQRLVKWVRRNKAASIGAAATFVVALAGIAGGIHLRREGIAAAAAELAAREEVRLDGLESDLDRLEAELRSIDAETAAGRHETAVAGATTFARRHADLLARLAGDNGLRERRPDAWTRAGRLAGEAEIRHRAAQAAWLESTLDAAGPPEEADAATVREVAGAFDRFRKVSSEGSLGLPVARLALWQVRAALAAGDAGAADNWVARAYVAEPGSESAGRAFLLLAVSSLESGDHERAARQYHLALGSFGEGHASLRAPILLGLVRSLASLGAWSKAPFQDDVPAREMALRALLSLVDVRGVLLPAIASSLPPETARTTAIEAARWLGILRRSTAAADVPDGFGLTSIDGRAVFLDHDEEASELRGHVLVDPPGPGTAPPRFEPTFRTDLAAANDALGARASRLRVLDLLPGPGPQLCLSVGVKEGEGKSVHLVVLRSPTDPTVVGTAQFPVHPGSLTGGDVDGDGRADLVAFLGQPYLQPVVSFQVAPGRFSPPVPLAPDPIGSYNEGIAVADLDGDGKHEVLLSRGLYNHLTLEVVRCGADRRPQRVARLPTGRLSFRLAPTASGRRRILASVRLGEDVDRALEKLGRPAADGGILAYEFDGRSIVRVADEGWPPPGARDFAGYDMGGSLEIEGGHRAIVLRRRGAGHGPDRLFVFQADPPGTPGAVLSMDRSALEFGAVLREGSRAYRRLTDADLAEIGRRPIATDRIEAADPTVSVARHLLRLGLPAQAVASIEEARAARRVDPEVETELTRISIAALDEARRVDDLAALLASLEPDDRLAGDVLVATDRLALVSGRYDEAIAILDRWRRDPDLTPAMRDAFLRRRLDWESLADLQRSPRIETDGSVLKIGTERRPLASAVATSQPGGLTVTRDGTLLLRASAADVATGPSFAGIGIDYAGGDLRYEIDLRWTGIERGESIHLGLLDPANLDGRLGIFLRTKGSNEIDRVLLGFARAEATVDDRAGRWLRVTVEYLAAVSSRRIVVADRDRRQVLFHSIDRIPPPPAGRFVLGVAARKPPAEVDLEFARFAVAGEVRLRGPDDPDPPAWLDPAWAAEVSRAVSDRLAGRTEEAARRLRTLAEQANDSAPAPARWSIRLAAEAEWLAAAGDAGSFAGAMAARVTDPGDLEPVVAWLATRVDGSADGPWRAAAHLAARVLAGGRPPREVHDTLAARLQDREAKFTPADALLADWVAAELAGPTRELARLVAFRALADSARTPEVVHILEDRLLALLEDVQDAPAPAQAAWNVRRALILARRLRRHEAVAIPLPAGLPPDVTNLLDLQRRLIPERAEELEKDCRQAARDGVPFR